MRMFKQGKGADMRHAKNNVHGTCAEPGDKQYAAGTGSKLRLCHVSALPPA